MLWEYDFPLGGSVYLLPPGEVNHLISRLLHSSKWNAYKHTHTSLGIVKRLPTKYSAVTSGWLVWKKTWFATEKNIVERRFSESYHSFAWFFFWKWIAFACSIFQRHWLDKSGTNGDRVLPAASGGSSGMLSIGKSHLGRGYKQIRIILFKHSFVCRLCS